MYIETKNRPRVARFVEVIVIALGFFMSFGVIAQTTVYTADFESGAPAEFSTGGTTSSQIGAEAVNQGMSTYLGQFTTSGSTTLTLTGLPAHNFVRLDVDVYFFSSWDGSNGSYGPDYFSLAGDVIFSETFTNHHGTIGTPQQSYPTLADVYLSSDGTSLSSWGSSSATFVYFSMGPTSSGTGFIEPHTSGTFSVTFGGPTSQTDEQWGIDNVKVTVCETIENCEPTSAPPPVSVVPTEPVPALGGLELLLMALVLGFFGVIMLRRMN